MSTPAYTPTAIKRDFSSKSPTTNSSMCETMRGERIEYAIETSIKNPIKIKFFQ